MVCLYAKLSSSGERELLMRQEKKEKNPTEAELIDKIYRRGK